MDFPKILPLMFVTCLSACSASPELLGSVVDEWGNPIGGATVSIANSGFTATTDVGGHYKLAYAPGTFLVEFSEPEHAPREVELSLADRTSFPMETIELRTLPPESGIYLVGLEGYVPLATAGIVDIKTDEGWQGTKHDYYIYPSSTWMQDESLMVRDFSDWVANESPLTVADADPQVTSPFLVDNQHIGSITAGLMGSQEDVTPVDETTIRYGEFIVRKLDIHLSELKDHERVCFLPVVRNTLGSRLIKTEDSRAFCITPWSSSGGSQQGL